MKPFGILAVLAALSFGGFCQAKSPPVDLVRVVKSERILYLLGGGKVLRQYRIALGGSPTGPKRQEGDERTPEGRYLLDFKKGDSAYFRAIHVSYPDEQDRASARRAGVDPGGAIMIHGQRNRFGWLGRITQRFDWTDGCIALANPDMDEVWRLVSVPVPIDIVP